ncbi:MAG: hypothetical protein QW470_02040 [Candidatus Caldarchaeum sp.]
MDKVGVGLGRLIGFFGDRNVFLCLRTTPWVRAVGVRLYVKGAQPQEGSGDVMRARIPGKP